MGADKRDQKSAGPPHSVDRVDATLDTRAVPIPNRRRNLTPSMVYRR
jgi:hypothetical protein